MKNKILLLLLFCSILSFCGCSIEEQKESSKNIFSFSDLENVEFWFGSGAGGWSTSLWVNSDGSFQGVYHDSEMGSVGEEYPNGTFYQCVFHGEFEPLEKVNDYCYATSIKKISYENRPGTQEIIDDVLYVYSTPYGIEDAEEILIYLPGMPTDRLPEGYLSWTHFSLLENYDSQKIVDELPFYGLYNVAGEEGFSSFQHEESEKLK